MPDLEFGSEEEGSAFPCMRVKGNQRDESSAGKSLFLRRMIPAPVILLLVGSLLVLIAAGFQKSPGLKLAVSVFAVPLLVGALIKTFRTADLFSPRLMNATPKQLAWIRILVCLSAFIMTTIENLPAISRMPVAFQRTGQFFHLLHMLPGYATLVSNPHLLAILQWTTASLLLLAMIGFQTRVTLLLGGLCFFVMQAILRQYTYYFHTGLLPLYLLLLLPWTPCAAAWSIDRWLHPAKHEASRQTIGFAVYTCYAVIALVYLFCGLSKMRDSGFDWFHGENLQHKFVQDAMNPIFLDYKWKATLWLVQHDAPTFVFSAIGMIGVAAELGYFTVLFWQTARIVMPVAAFGVHAGILVFQHILFLDLLVLQLVFLNADRLGAFVAQRFPWYAPQKNLPVPFEHRSERMALPLGALAAMSMLIAGLFLIWVFRVNYYPVSDWHMYSRTSSKEPIFYYRMVATLEDGRSMTVPRRDYFPAVMPNNLSTLAKAFRQPWRNGSFDQFLSAYVESRNRRLPSAPRISTIEIQRWRWNYGVDPHDPRFGWITHRYVYDAAAKHSERAAALR